MARRTTTYAIRLAVEGGGQVKAELVSVGQSGEQSLQRIETAGDRASGGLKGLGRQAELLRTGIRTLGGALLGAATVGGLGALIDRSISAADAIGKTADKIGVGVEALQELRFAAKASGVEQQTLDMALQRFTRRAAEAAQGTGEAKDALAQMGIALRDQSGNLRRSEELLAEVADAFVRIEDPAERVRLAFKLFDSEGVALVTAPVAGALQSAFAGAGFGMFHEGGIVGERPPATRTCLARDGQMPILHFLRRTASDRCFLPDAGANSPGQQARSWIIDGEEAQEVGMAIGACRRRVSVRRREIAQAVFQAQAVTGLSKAKRRHR